MIDCQRCGCRIIEVGDGGELLAGRAESFVLAPKRKLTRTEIDAFKEAIERFWNGPADYVVIVPAEIDVKPAVVAEID